MKITFRRDADGFWGSYDVYADGVKVGNVYKRQTHYNLQRPVTVTYWRVEHDSDFTHFRTRAEAAAWAAAHPWVRKKLSETS